MALWVCRNLEGALVPPGVGDVISGASKLPSKDSRGIRRKGALWVRCEVWSRVGAGRRRPLPRALKAGVPAGERLSPARVPSFTAPHAPTDCDFVTRPRGRRGEASQVAGRGFGLEPSTVCCVSTWGHQPC